MEKFDVVIVGLGPAGSAAAKILKDNGQNVLVVEKEKLPRDKCCGGMIFPYAQTCVREHFGNIPEELYSQPKIMKAIKFVLQDGSHLDIPPDVYKEGDNTLILSVSRSAFDHWLAKESGAVLKDQCRFSTFQKEKGELIVTCALEGKKITLRTRYLIGADGGNSAVRRMAIPDFDKQEFLIPSYYEHWTGTMDLEPDYFYLFENEKFTEGFAFPPTLIVKDGCWVLDVCAKSGSPDTTIKECHKIFMDYLINAHNFKPGEKVHSNGCICNLAGFNGYFHLGNSNVLLAGEAAGFLRAFGEGITSALITGRIAGKAILKSMESGIEALAVYADMVEAEKNLIIAQHEQLKAVRA